MADAYKGLTIQFRGDTTDLSRKLSSLRRDSSEVERELRAIDRALELDPGNVELLGQRARYSAQQANILQERLLRPLAEASAPLTDEAGRAAPSGATMPPNRPRTGGVPWQIR